MAKPVLYYDGPCHLCQRFVHWVHLPCAGCCVCAFAERRSEKALPEALVTPPLTGVVLVDTEERSI